GQEQSGRQGAKGADWRVVRISRSQDRRSSIRVRDQAGSDRKQTGCRYRGSWETYTKALIASLAIPYMHLLQSASGVLADCRSEPLVAESTRWPVLVLQPTRQVSPTTIGESIPDSA
ncbi:unnamed protein product, partial [Staurois parvus]